jgi:hypothetical protein
MVDKHMDMRMREHPVLNVWNAMEEKSDALWESKNTCALG